MDKESLKDYLPNESDNFWFVDEIFDGIADKLKEGIEPRNKPQKVLYLVCHANGIIENGGFFYFFEFTFNVNEVARAYETVGLEKSADLMRQALAKFPNSRRPADFKECMKFLDQHEEFFEDLSTEFLGSQNEPIEDILASYIRKNAEAFQEYLK